MQAGIQCNAAPLERLFARSKDDGCSLKAKASDSGVRNLKLHMHAQLIENESDDEERLQRARGKKCMATKQATKAQSNHLLADLSVSGLSLNAVVVAAAVAAFAGAAVLLNFCLYCAASLSNC